MVNAVNSYLQSSNFKLVINKLPNSAYFAQNASIPSITLDSTPIKVPMGTIYTPGTRIEFGQFSYNFKVDEDLTNYKEIYNWMLEIAPVEDLTSGVESSLKYTDATLYSLTNKQNPNVMVVFRDMFPVGITEVMYNSTDTEIIYPEVTVSFMYRMFTFK